MEATKIALGYAAALNEKFRNEPEYSANKFSVEPGRRYDRIVQSLNSNPTGTSVHAFIDRETGNLLKAASWNTPAKGVRYAGDVLFTVALKNADLHGRYLYADYKKIL